MKLRLTFVKDEIGLQPVYLRLACLPDEGARARAVRAALSMIHETSIMPRWFLSLPETTGPLPRSFTVRIALLDSDPSLIPVINQLARFPEVDRAGWLKNLIARSLGHAPGALAPFTAADNDESKPRISSLPPIPKSASQLGGTTHANTSEGNNTDRTRLFKNALKAFDLDLVQNSPT